MNSSATSASGADSSPAAVQLSDSVRVFPGTSPIRLPGGHLSQTDRVVKHPVLLFDEIGTSSLTRVVLP